MIYLKINEDQSITYPYSIQQLKSENKNTSFPQYISNELLLQYGVYTVISVSKGDDYTKNYSEETPILVSGSYYQNWVVSDATEEEISLRIDSKWSEIRSIRNLSLSECDWTQIADSPLSELKKSEWSIYRQSLRDITLQEDPYNIVWPTKPE